MDLPAAKSQPRWNAAPPAPVPPGSAGPRPNTRDLRYVGFDEVVTWCFAVVWRQVGLLVRVWVSNPALCQGALVLSTVPDVVDATRTVASPDGGTPAGTVVLPSCDLRVRGGGTVVGAGAAPLAGEATPVCRPGVPAPAGCRPHRAAQDPRLAC